MWTKKRCPVVEDGGEAQLGMPVSVSSPLDLVVHFRSFGCPGPRLVMVDQSSAAVSNNQHPSCPCRRSSLASAVRTPWLSRLWDVGRGWSSRYLSWSSLFSLFLPPTVLPAACQQATALQDAVPSSTLPIYLVLLFHHTTCHATSFSFLCAFDNNPSPCSSRPYTTMGAGAFIEPLVVVSLLFGGTWVNRNSEYRLFASSRHDRHANRATSPSHDRSDSPDSIESALESPTAVDGLLPRRFPSPSPQEGRWRKREFQLFGFRRSVTSPNTRVFKDRFLSRLLNKFPFLVEAWYWALIYWV